MTAHQASDWSPCLRPPVIIPPEEATSIDLQLAIFAGMGTTERMRLGLDLIDTALRQRRDRLRRTFPAADEQGLNWAVIREILGLDPGTDPVPR